MMSHEYLLDNQIIIVSSGKHEHIREPYQVMWWQSYPTIPSSHVI